jgi:hypothetical protein
MERRVVAWVPVPKAIPGVMSMELWPLFSRILTRVALPQIGVSPEQV